MPRSPPKTSSSPLHNSEPDLSTSITTGLKEHITQRKRKRGDDVELYRIETMMLEMKSMFTDFVAIQTQHNSKIDSLYSALEDIRSQNSLITSQNAEIRTQNSEIQQCVQFLSDKYDDAILKINNLEAECNSNQKTMKSLELKIDYLERNLKTSTIEIKNIPSSNPENRETLTESLVRLGSIINQPIPPSEIKQIFRLRGKKETVGTVIVEFSSTSTKEQFLRSTRIYNKHNLENRLSTTHLHATGPSKPIYVSEALTSAAKRLHYLAREFVKTSEYEQCWTTNGKVYVREREGLPSRLIKAEEDLAKLRKQK